MITKCPNVNWHLRIVRNIFSCGPWHVNPIVPFGYTLHLHFLKLSFLCIFLIVILWQYSTFLNLYFEYVCLFICRYHTFIFVSFLFVCISTCLTFCLVFSQYILLLYYPYSFIFVHLFIFLLYNPSPYVFVSLFFFFISNQTFSLAYWSLWERNIFWWRSVSMRARVVQYPRFK